MQSVITTFIRDSTLHFTRNTTHWDTPRNDWVARCCLTVPATLAAIAAVIEA